MAKVTTLLWKHKTNRKGEHPIRLRFADTDQTLYLGLRVSVRATDWNPRTRRVRKGHPVSDEINALIAARLADAERARIGMLAAGEEVTAQALKDALTGAAEAPDPCFLEYVESFLKGVEKSGNVARADRERAVMNKLKAFAKSKRSGRGPVRLPFSALTTDLLRGFEAYLMGTKKNKASTVQSNMNVLRLHVRRAIAEGVIGRDADPFFAYTPPRAKRTERLKLTEKQVRSLEEVDVGVRGPEGSLDARVLDAFLFALYAAGVRFGDLAWLRRSDVHEEVVDDRAVLRLSYTARKTGKRTSTLLVPPAVRIVKPYLAGDDGGAKPPGAFLFPILDGYDLSTPRAEDKAGASQNALHNKTLKRLAKLAKIDGNLTMHVARHSFADLARRQGWDSYDISKALRHSSIAITERYLAGFDSAALDEKMIGLFTN